MPPQRLLDRAAEIVFDRHADDVPRRRETVQDCRRHDRIYERRARKELLAMAREELECGVGERDQRVRRAARVLVAQVRDDRPLVRIAAELRRVEELVERVNRLRRRVGQRLAQAAVRIGIARRQAAVREDNQDSKDFPLRKCLMVPIANGADCRSLIGLG
jgi:hypothetical protein